MIIFKTELIRRVWEKVNVDSEGYKDRIKQVDVETIINTFLQEMSQCMIDGDDIVLKGFGKFMSKIRRARTTYNSMCKTEVDKHIKGEGNHE